MPDSGDRQYAPPVGFNVLYRRQDRGSELKGPIRLSADTFQHYLTDLGQSEGLPRAPAPSSLGGPLDVHQTSLLAGHKISAQN